MFALVRSSEVADPKEVIVLLNLLQSGHGEVVAAKLRAIIRDRIGECPGKLAEMLGEVSVAEEVVTAKLYAGGDVAETLRQRAENSYYVGLALSESITGVPGEVLCNVPMWLFEEAKGTVQGEPLNISECLRSITSSIKSFFGRFVALGSPSTDDIGGMCGDAVLLFWVDRFAGVRRVPASEYLNQRERFVYEFTTTSKMPEGWTMVGFEQRIAM